MDNDQATYVWNPEIYISNFNTITIDMLPVSIRYTSRVYPNVVAISFEHPVYESMGESCDWL